MTKIPLALAIALTTVPGCVTDDTDTSSPRSGESCLPGGGVGLIGLDGVDLGGTPRIEGPYAGVFSNGHVDIFGTADLYGSAGSASSVSVSGSAYVEGEVVEDAAEITVPDPTPWLEAAKLDNDNDLVPCIKKGKGCTSPLSGYDFALNSKSEVVLPAGTYYFESLQINGQAKLGTAGDVTIYLNGPATINGGSATDPGTDALTIVSASSDLIKVNGGSESKMHIYAPFAEVRFSGTSGFVGTALGKTLTATGTTDISVSDSLEDLWGMGCEPPEEDPPGLPEIPD